jgi:hypothetical protein
MEIVWHKIKDGVEVETIAIKEKAKLGGNESDKSGDNDLTNKNSNESDKSEKSGGNELTNKGSNESDKSESKIEKSGGNDLDLLNIEPEKSEPKVDKHKQVKKDLKQLKLLPDDRVSELKDKIYLITDVLPCMQYLYYVENDEQHPISYQIRLDGPLHLDIWERLKKGPMLLGVPIDEGIYRQKDSIEVHGYDYFTSVQMLRANNITKLHLVNMADIVTQSTDTHTLALWYYSFIRLYFPMWNLEALQIWCSKPEQLNESFPELTPNKDRLQRTYAAQELLLTERLEGVTEMVLRMATWQTKQNEGMVRIPDLVNNIKTSEKIPWLRAVWNRTIFTKISQLYGENAYEHTKHRTLQPDNLTANLCVKLHEHEFAQLIISENYPVQVKTFWSEEQQMRYEKLQNMIIKHANPVLDQINGLGRKILNSRWGLTTFTSENSVYSSLTLNLFWKKQLTPTQYQVMVNMLRQDAGSGILSVDEDQNNICNFRFYKGIWIIDRPPIEDYGYLTNSKTRQRWQSTYKGRLCTMMLRATDVKFELADVLELEAPVIQTYIEGLIERVIPEIAKVKEGPESKIGNRLKLLKNRDPELFDFRHHGSDVVYSRICQKQRQPLPLTEAEISQYQKKHPKAKLVKFHNFTSKGNLFYTCPDAKFPHLSFIEGHPKNFCLPCCIMTAKDRPINSNCWDTGLMTTDEETAQPSRYIMNYGKGLEVGRLSNLPEPILRFLIYNSRLVGHIKDITAPTYYLYGVPQNTSLINDIGYFYCIADAMQMKPGQIIDDILVWAKTKKYLFGTILGGQLPLYFDNWNEMLNELERLFKTQKGLPYTGKFLDWNELLMYFAEQINIITVILEDTNSDMTGTSQSKGKGDTGFRMCLTRQVENTDQYFEDKTYIVVLRKPKKQRSLKSSNFYYSPIYLVVPQNFFKNLAIEKRNYNLSEDLIQLLKQLCGSSFNKQDINHLQITMDKLKQIKINWDDCYKYGAANRLEWVLAPYRKHYVLIPVPSQAYSDITERPELADLDLVDIKELEEFLESWKEKPDSYLVMRDTNKIIGVKTDTYWWCKESKLANQTNIHYVWQHPDIINDLLAKLPIEPPSGPLVKTAEQKLLSYHQYQREIMAKLDSERNSKARSKILQISKISSSKKRELTMRELGLSNSDLARLSNNNWRIDIQQAYDFDGVTLNKLRDCVSAKEAGKILKKISGNANKDYINMMAAEMLHPISREYLLQSVLLPEATAMLEQYSGEEIYIKPVE